MAEPVVLERVENRPGERGRGADRQEPTERHAAGPGEKTGRVAQSADEPTDEHPDHAAGRERAPEHLDAFGGLAKPAAEAQQQALAAPTPDRIPGGCAGQRAERAG